MHKLYHSILLLIFGLIYVQLAISQEQPVEELTGWKVEEFTLPGGTNGNLVTAISEGPNGYMLSLIHI